MSLDDKQWGRNSGSGSGDGRNGDGRNRGPDNNNDGPPDLDELWRDFNRKLGRLFGGRGPGGGGDDIPPRGPSRGLPPMGGRGAGIGAGIAAAAVALLWLGSGFYIVQEGQAAAVMRFGEFVHLNDKAGLSWRLPYPFSQHETVNVQQLRQIEIGYRGNVRNKVLRESLILTGDQSIVDLQYAVQFRIGDPVAWLFNNNPGNQPEELIRQAAETAMRQVVGQRGIDQVLYEEKEQVAKAARDLMQKFVERYKAGVTVVDVTIQQAQPPEQVQAAFEDANKAAQDRERLINEGRAYANDVIPKARGAAARLMEEAEAHKARAVATATGDASRFTAVQREYAKAPQVTRDRMYLDTMQQIFANTSKVFVDSRAPGSLLYLPLDKLMQATGAGANGANAAPATSPGLGAPADGATVPAVPAVPATPGTDPRGGREGILRNRDREASR